MTHKDTKALDQFHLESAEQWGREVATIDNELLAGTGPAARQQSRGSHCPAVFDQGRDKSAYGQLATSAKTLKSLASEQAGMALNVSRQSVDRARVESIHDAV